METQQIEETREFEIAELEQEYFESTEYLGTRALDELQAVRKSLWNSGREGDLKRAEMAIWYLKRILKLEKDI
jgi:hypothetical protein